MASWKDYILHLKRKLEKGVGADKTLHILHKLEKVPITLELLQETGIGKVVAALKKQDGAIGDRAKSLVGDWKKIVQVEQEITKNVSPVKSGQERKSSKYTSQETHHSKTNSKNYHSSSYENNYAYESEGEGKSCYDPMNSGSGDFANGKVKVKYESELEQPYEETSKYSETIHSPNSYDPHSSRDDYKNYVSSFAVGKTPESYTYVPSPTKQKVRVSEENERHEHKHRERKHKESPITKEKYVLDESEAQPSHRHSSSKSSHSGDSRNSSKKKNTKSSILEGFNNSLCSFEDCLGLNDVSVKTKKKKPVQLVAPMPALVHNSTKSESKVKVKREKEEHYPHEESSHSRKKTSKSKRKDACEKVEVPMVLKKVKLEPLEEVDVLSTLPEIQPYYKPMRHLKMPDSPPQKKKSMSNEEAIIYTSSRKEKTAVYAGRRTFHLSEVPTLQDACLRVLAENIERCDYLGEVPYYMLKTVLEKCSAGQLYNLEDYNPHLLEDTDELWHIHCRRDFKTKAPAEDETWRDLYLRLHDEREAKLKNVTANISASMAKATPVRQTKLAYVDSVAKPPRDVARRQAKHGTGLPVATPMKIVPLGRATPRPTAPQINASNSSTNSSSAQPKKPKVAPLMQKTLKFMKQRFRR